MFKIFQPDNQ